MKPHQLYEHLCNSPSDINEHLPTLYRLARGKSRVVELGVRQGVSTVALLVAQPLMYHGYDLNEPPTHLESVAAECNVVYHQHIGNDLDLPVSMSDLLFIDTLHTGNQLFAELRRFGPLCGDTIVMHDVFTFGYQGEDGTLDGLCPALFRFLAENRNWRIEEWHNNNNGLAVLRRRG